MTDLRLPETLEAMLSVLSAGKAGPWTQVLASRLVVGRKVITAKAYAEVREQVLKEAGGS
jgi:hypothetical protein